jgi:hypothetical protein
VRDDAAGPDRDDRHRADAAPPPQFLADQQVRVVERVLDCVGHPGAQHSRQLASARGAAGPDRCTGVVEVAGVVAERDQRHQRVADELAEPGEAVAGVPDDQFGDAAEQFLAGPGARHRLVAERQQLEHVALQVDAVPGRDCLGQVANHAERSSVGQQAAADVGDELAAVPSPVPPLAAQPLGAVVRGRRGAQRIGIACFLLGREHVEDAQRTDVVAGVAEHA